MILDFFGHTYYVETNEDRYRPNNNNDHITNNNNNNKNYDHLPHYKGGKYDYKSYEPYLPSYDILRQDNNNNRDKDRNYWGYDNNRYGGYYGYDYYDNLPNRHYLPQKTSNKYWGQYGGSYGNGGSNFIYLGYKDNNNQDYWGLNGLKNRVDTTTGIGSGYDLPQDNYGPGYHYIYHAPEPGLTYLPASYDKTFGNHYAPDTNLNPPIKPGDGLDTGVYPPTTFDRPGHNFIKDGKNRLNWIHYFLY